MAQLIGLRAYQVNSQDPIPPTSVPFIGFPFAGILVRGITGGLQLSTGQVVYSQVQLIATGSVYLVAETPAQIISVS